MKFLFSSTNKVVWEHSIKEHESNNWQYYHTDVHFNYTYFIDLRNVSFNKSMQVKIQWSLAIQFKNSSILRYVADTIYVADTTFDNSDEEHAADIIQDAFEKYSNYFDILKMQIGFQDKLPVFFTKSDYIEAAKSLIKQIYLKVNSNSRKGLFI